jgi:hypothetical protein
MLQLRQFLIRKDVAFYTCTLDVYINDLYMIKVIYLSNITVKDVILFRAGYLA